MIEEEKTFKPTNKKPVTDQSKSFEKNFKKTMINHNVTLNEIDDLLSEEEMSLKKKVFKLDKMESLVFSDPKLSAEYEKMSQDGKKRYGYHANETIMNILFNDYVLNSSKYFQKYKNAKPIEKKRRDKSGIDQAKKAGEEKMKKQDIEKNELDEYLDKIDIPNNENDCVIESNGFDKYSVNCAGEIVGEYNGMREALDVANDWIKNNVEAELWYKSERGNISLIDGDGNFINTNNVNDDQLDETTSAGSAAGAGSSYVGYAGPSAWSGSGKSIHKKPIYSGGVVIGESNYLTDSFGFEKYYKYLSENNDIDFIQKNSEAYGSLNNMNKNDLNIIKTDIEKGTIEEKAKSKSQQRFMGMVSAVQKGKLDPNKVSKKIKDVASSMKQKDVDDFASTKHEDLPEKVNEVKKINTIELYTKLRNGGKSEETAAAAVLDVLSKGESKKWNKHKFDYMITRLVPALNKKINEESMIDDNPTSMSLKPTPKDNYSNIERGMTTNEELDGGRDLRKPKIQRLVDELNRMIELAVDNEGDPIGVIDTTSTWEELYVYEPIIYNKMGQLIIKSKSIYDNSRQNIEKIKNNNMEFDGIPMLRELMKQYRKVLKNKNINGDITMNTELNEINEELNAITKHHNQLKHLNENIFFQDEFTPTGYLTLSNSGGIEVEIASSGDGLRYKYTDDIEPTEAEIQYDEDGDAFFTTTEGHEYKLNEFMRTNYMNEDRKPSSLVMKDRLGNENKSNFKKDLQNSGTKEVINVEKELQWKDQQTNVNKNPYKAAEDIEKDVLKRTKGEALKNVGNSANEKGDEIPKRNLTDNEYDEVKKIRKGMEDWIFDNEPDKRFVERMKNDMGEEKYKEREEKIKYNAKAPMYNKDTQPIDNGIKKVQYDKEKSGWNEREGLDESVVTGKYVDLLNKIKYINFRLNEAKVIKNNEDDMFQLDLSGLGNTLSNNGEINENLNTVLKNLQFFTDGVNVFYKLGKTNISENVKTDSLDKMKHLLGYNPNNYINTKNIKKNRGF